MREINTVHTYVVLYVQPSNTPELCFSLLQKLTTTFQDITAQINKVYTNTTIKSDELKKSILMEIRAAENKAT